MADPVVVLQHIRVGGRTMCGIKCQIGVHVIPWLDALKAPARRLCPTCLSRYRIQQAEKGYRLSRQTSRTRATREARELAGWHNTPRLK